MSIAYIALLVCVARVNCVPLIIEQFSSQSFVPDDIKVAFNIEQQTRIDYNLTIEEPFPGKILMNVFVRRLSEAGSTAPSKSFIKFRNLDFCKALESLRNLTIDPTRNKAFIPKTFLSSCPLTPGFYYLKAVVIDFHVLPANIDDGRYLVIMELLQVYEEVTLLVNVKVKCIKHTPEGAAERPFRFDSDEDGEKAEEEGANDDTSNEHKNNKEGAENENGDEPKNKSAEDEVLEKDDDADQAEAEELPNQASDEKQQEEEDSKKEEEEETNNDKEPDEEEEDFGNVNGEADYQDEEKQEVVSIA